MRRSTVDKSPEPSVDETITLLTRRPSKTSATSTIDRTFLTTGFGLRNTKSLERALREKRKIEKDAMTLEQRRKMLEQLIAGTDEEYMNSSMESDKYSDVISQTESVGSLTFPSASSSTSTKQSTISKRLEYLIGVVDGQSIAEEASKEEWRSSKLQEEPEPPPPPQTSEAMKHAQRYLRMHKIFELFQFLTAHLLSAVPENAIEFITDMLSKCLIFRSGYGEPPLLYNRRHIGELFNLMDPMRTGYISHNQYKTGMYTLGICIYNSDPPKNEEGLISKEFFVEEAYECLTDLLNDLIRRRGAVTAPNAPPPTPYVQSQVLWDGVSERSSNSSMKESDEK